MKLKSAAIAVLTLSTSVCAPNTLLAQDPPRPEYHNEAGWDAPPSEGREIGHRGFRDGIEGARKDFENHRRPNVMNRDEYRHPPVGGADRDEYRAAFRRGYDRGVEHMLNGGTGHYD